MHARHKTLFHSTRERSKKSDVSRTVYKMNLFWSLVCVIVFQTTGVFTDCTSSNGGLTLSCKEDFDGDTVSLVAKIKSCANPVKVGVSLKVDSLGIDWSEDFVASKDIPIPGFSVLGFGVYLNFKVSTKDNGNLDLEISLTAKVIGLKVVSVKVLEEEIPDSNCNSFLLWWNQQSTAIKGVGGTAVAIATILLLTGCCCCCCRCCRNQSPPPTAILLPQAGGPTVVQTNMHNIPTAFGNYNQVPYEKHVNYVA